MTHFYLLIIFLVGVFSCKSIPFSPDDPNVDFIRFGNGGGFTGSVNVYYITRNGYLYKDEGNFPQKIGKVDEKIATQMFALPDILQMEKNPYDLPGNRYFFIECQLKEIKQKITWGGDSNHPQAYETWYHNLMHLVKKVNLKE